MVKFILLQKYKLEIAQHIRDISLIKSFIPFFSCGAVYKHKNDTISRYSVSSFIDISEKIIPFLAYIKL
jgi:hypothetical protein